MLQGVIFDLDGTIVDSDLDFGAIRDEIGFVTGPILEFRDSQATAEQKARIDDVLGRHETRAAETCILQPGARALLAALRELDLRLALLTRNSARTVSTVLARHGLEFDTIVSREDAAAKPSPEPVFLICRRLSIRPEATLMVGDYKFDVESGANAGCRTVLLRTPIRSRFEASPDWEVDSLVEIVPIVMSCMDGGAKEEVVA